MATEGLASSSPETVAHWHVLRSKPKAEHLAAVHLDRIEGVEVFCPRIAYRKPTRRGPVRFVEALFLGYLFAKFSPDAELRRVRATPQVSEVLHFGAGLASLSEETIAQLREEFPDSEPRELAPPSAEIAPGDEVEILTGALSGITALISQVLPGEERVRILLDWLGDTREVELSSDALRKSGRGN